MHDRKSSDWFEFALVSHPAERERNLSRPGVTLKGCPNCYNFPVPINFIHPGWKRCCQNKVSCPRTQCTDSSQGLDQDSSILHQERHCESKESCQENNTRAWTGTAQSRGECTDHRTTIPSLMIEWFVRLLHECTYTNIWFSYHSFCACGSFGTESLSFGTKPAFKLLKFDSMFFL